MRFLTKIRERQFAKKWRGTYNLSRAVLAGVLAAGCLMPGFAEAAVFLTQDQNGTNFDVERTPGDKTTTIIGNISGTGTRYIYIGRAMKQVLKVAKSMLTTLTVPTL